MSLQETHANPSRKLAVFRVISLVMVIAFGVFLLGLAEWGIRWRRQSTGQQDVMDPVLIRYDPELGWALNAGSVGGHTNSDFGTVYRIGATGFRADALLPEVRRHDLHVFMGDSFVFGFGVSEEETFVHLLNAQASAKGHFLNCGVPGFSTDQEALLLERILRELKPEVVWLVVYLANDLLDIRHGRAIQVNQPKPYYELVQDRLELRHSPVPRLTGEAVESPPDLALAILGPEFYRNHWRASLERRSLLFQAFSEWCLESPDVAGVIADRLPPALDLFNAILASMEERCRKGSVRLRLAFMPGRSMVERPESIPGQYQRMLLSALQARPAIARLAPIDLHPFLASSNQLHPGRYFFPNDGHLTREGQRVVADALAAVVE